MDLVCFGLGALSYIITLLLLSEMSAPAYIDHDMQREMLLFLPAYVLQRMRTLSQWHQSTINCPQFALDHANFPHKSEYFFGVLIPANCPAERGGRIVRKMLSAQQRIFDRGKEIAAGRKGKEIAAPPVELDRENLVLFTEEGKESFVFEVCNSISTPLRLSEATDVEIVNFCR